MAAIRNELQLHIKIAHSMQELMQLHCLLVISCMLVRHCLRCIRAGFALSLNSPHLVW